MVYSHVLIDSNEEIINWFKTEEDARAALIKEAQEQGYELDDETCDELGVVDLECLTDDDIERMHDEILDECCDEIKIGSLRYQPSDVLKSTDPLAHRCSVADYHSSLIDDGCIEGPDGNLYRIS